MHAVFELDQLVALALAVALLSELLGADLTSSDFSQDESGVLQMCRMGCAMPDDRARHACIGVLAEVSAGLHI